MSQDNHDNDDKKDPKDKPENEAAAAISGFFQVLGLNEPLPMEFNVPENTAMVIRHVQDSPTACHLDLWVNNAVGGHDQDHIVHNVVMMLLERPHTRWSLESLAKVAAILADRVEGVKAGFRRPS